MLERPSPETTKRRYKRVRRLPAVLLVAFLAPAFAPGSAMAVPSFTGAANVAIDLLSFGGSVAPNFDNVSTFENAGTPSDAANASGSAALPGTVPGTITLGGAISGSAPVGFAEAASYAEAIIPLRTTAEQDFLLLSFSGPSVALGSADGAFVIVDFQIGILPVIPALAPGDERPAASLIPDFSAFPFGPADYFDPDDLLFSCSASILDPTGCFGPTNVEEIPVEPNANNTLVAVLTVRGTTRTEQAAAVPTPSALGLLGLAVVGLGVASRRRIAA